MTKRFVTESMAKAVSECIPLMGGTGLLSLHPLDRMSRDLRANLFVGGTNDIMAISIFKDLRDMS